MGKQKYNRIFTIVIDSLGVGALSDASDYGDAGTDTLGHISQNVAGGAGYAGGYHFVSVKGGDEMKGLLRKDLYVADKQTRILLWCPCGGDPTSEG